MVLASKGLILNGRLKMDRNACESQCRHQFLYQLNQFVEQLCFVFSVWMLVTSKGHSGEFSLDDARP